MEDVLDIARPKIEEGLKNRTDQEAHSLRELTEMTYS